jgi:hypothetical protein
MPLFPRSPGERPALPSLDSERPADVATATFALG